MQNRHAVGLILICLVTVTSYLVENLTCFADEQGSMKGAGEECPHEIGSYERKVYFFKLYKVSFHTIEPARIAEMYRAQQAGDEGQRSPVDSVAHFLLDPQNRIPLRLTIETLRGKIQYDVQKKAVREMLGRAGYPVDEDWNLTGLQEHQEDVKLYVKTIMGLNSKEHEQLSRTMKKGDRFILLITSEDTASVTYEPGQENRISSPNKVLMSSTDVLRGIFLTYLSTEACGSDLKDKLPKALMKKILAECQG
jgi:hypothetical protein